MVNLYSQTYVSNRLNIFLGKCSMIGYLSKWPIEELGCTKLFEYSAPHSQVFHDTFNFQYFQIQKQSIYVSAHLKDRPFSAMIGEQTFIPSQSINHHFIVPTPIPFIPVPFSTWTGISPFHTWTSFPFLPWKRLPIATWQIISACSACCSGIPPTAM